MGAEDVADEQFVDTLILLAIPILSITLTALVYIIMYCVRKCKKRRNGDDKRDLIAEAFEDADSEIEAAMDETDEKRQNYKKKKIATQYGLNPNDV